MYTALFSLPHYFPPVIDCGSPPMPTNGEPSSTVSSTTFGAMVTYVCDVGYVLTGDSTVTCETSGQWSGPGPTCTGQ